MNKYQEALDRMYDNYVYGAKQKEDSYFTLQELVAKATPKKIIRTNEQEDCDGYVIASEYWNCPSCKARLLTGDNYCRKCGQALDWSTND